MSSTTRGAAPALQQLRQYSHRTSAKDVNNRLKNVVTTGYLCAAVVGPFVPPYLASQKTKQDGTAQTRPPLKYQYRPVI